MYIPTHYPHLPFYPISLFPQLHSHHHYRLSNNNNHNNPTIHIHIFAKNKKTLTRTTTHTKKNNQHIYTHMWKEKNKKYSLLQYNILFYINNQYIQHSPKNQYTQEKSNGKKEKKNSHYK